MTKLLSGVLVSRQVVVRAVCTSTPGGHDRLFGSGRSHGASPLDSATTAHTWGKGETDIEPAFHMNKE
ncbi:MAG: hypothetical protein WAW17_23540 [Rhodococcus sp. (in: high G+C Gram-positive bacteria)]|uniref:hypothetical protein n=1 Tax=Rhodococcus sp. TaxID=1831 RepID=UPI003BB05EF0